MYHAMDTSTMSNSVGHCTDYFYDWHLCDQVRCGVTAYILFVAFVALVLHELIPYVAILTAYAIAAGLNELLLLILVSILIAIWLTVKCYRPVRTSRRAEHGH